MHFHGTSLAGVVRIELEKQWDERGYFARTWCDREAAAIGLATPMRQDSIAFNASKGTLRGLHYHAANFPQARLVRCIAGAAFFAVVDLRVDGDSFLQTLDLTLEDRNYSALYVPPGLALGYQTLLDGTVIYYQMPELYDPIFERGVRWNDPAFKLQWPDPHPTINARDANFADFDVQAPARENSETANQ
ncbi:MAG: dTDP-4-dehydrorhamnose 3,5-epimerase family protein [Gammaproteobacteria bacterium]